MLRIVLSAIALAGVLSATRPAVADPPAAGLCDLAQAAAAARDEVAAPASARPSAPDAPANEKLGTDIIAVGFGWG